MKRKNVFISHHHRDDAHVDRFRNLMGRSRYDYRNSSIRAKPANQRRLATGLVKESTIRRLLRMKMHRASTVVVLVGEKTASRRWVNWEIEEANRLGRRIVGVYLHGGTESDVPKALDEYGDALVCWNTKSIADAVEGRSNVFQTPSGAPRPPVHQLAPSRC